MNSFKEAHLDDLDNVFFDEEELAERHRIDGKECMAILTDMTRSSSRNQRSALNPKETAINRSSYLFYIRDTELERKFTVNAMIELDGKKYFVQDVKHTNGVYRLAIGIHGV
ncbi:MAG: hypothetical protein NC517_12045 [Firmicutes bacterium]|nr:hypothetical protein [Bacillota bacterium]